MGKGVRILVACALVGACDRSAKSRSEPEPSSAAVAPVSASDAAVVVAVADAGAITDALIVDAGVIACTAAAIAALRKEAEAHAKASKYEAAHAVLQASTCGLEEVQPEALKAQIAWRISDLSFAYYKAGKFGECYDTASGQLPPYMGNVGHFFDVDHAAMKALAYNADLCKRAAAKVRGPFEASGPCTLATAGFGVPASALEGPDKAACLVLKPGKQDEDDMNVCGDVVLVRQSKQGRLSKTKLTVGDGNLAEGGVCCNVDVVSFSRRGAKLAILVETLGQNCHGGTAVSEEQHAYMLDGTTLEVFHELRSVAH